MPSLSRLFRARSAPLAFAALLGASAALAPAILAQRVIVSKAPPRSTRVEQDTAPTTHFSTLEGLAIDSLHMTPLAGATILVDGTTLSATTDKEGKFRIDSIPPGDYRLAMFHPLLDTLGFSIGTPPLRMGPDSLRQVIIATPSAQSVVKSACKPLQLKLGPLAIMGRITNADTQEPLDSVRVSMVWSEIEAGAGIGVRRIPRVREAKTDASGAFIICGIPLGTSGTLQAERGDAQTAEVPVQVDSAPLSMQSMMLSLQVADSGGLLGESEVSGRVVTEGSIPVPNATVTVQGAKMNAKTATDGTFRIGQLPAGTRTLFVRAVGFVPTELAIDLTPKQPAVISVRLSKAVNNIEGVVTEGTFGAALKKNGFADRKRMGLGRFLGPDDIARRQPQYFTSLFQTIPGFRVENTATGTTIKSTRDAQGGCVTYWVDGVQFRENQGGELDNYLRPEQLMAIETYSSSTAPAEFQSVGQTSCAVVVVWTNRTVRPQDMPKKSTR